MNTDNFPGRAEAVEEEAEEEEESEDESEDDVVDERKIRLKVPADVHVNMDTSLGRSELPQLNAKDFDTLM